MAWILHIEMCCPRNDSWGNQEVDRAATGLGLQCQQAMDKPERWLKSTSSWRWLWRSWGTSESGYSLCIGQKSWNESDFSVDCHIFPLCDAIKQTSTFLRSNCRSARPLFDHLADELYLREVDRHYELPQAGTILPRSNLCFFQDWELKIRTLLFEELVELMWALKPTFLQIQFQMDEVISFQPIFKIGHWIWSPMDWTNPLRQIWDKALFPFPP